MAALVPPTVHKRFIHIPIGAHHTI